MNFGYRFGQIVKQRRGIDGMTQEQLAIKAFGDPAMKSRISALENGKIGNPHQKTIDAICVALGMSEEDISAARNSYITNDTLEATKKVPFGLAGLFYLNKDEHVEIELVLQEDGKAFIFYNQPLAVHIIRIDFYVADKKMVWFAENGEIRALQTPLAGSMINRVSLNQTGKVTLNRTDTTGKTIFSQFEVPLRVYK